MAQYIWHTEHTQTHTHMRAHSLTHSFTVSFVTSCTYLCDKDANIIACTFRCMWSTWSCRSLRLIYAIFLKIVCLYLSVYWCHGETKKMAIDCIYLWTEKIYWRAYNYAILYCMIQENGSDSPLRPFLLCLTVVVNVCFCNAGICQAYLERENALVSDRYNPELQNKTTTNGNKNIP